MRTLNQARRERKINFIVSVSTLNGIAETEKLQVILSSGGD